MSRTPAPEITRSAGVSTSFPLAPLCGSGYSGSTAELDQVVQRAAELLRVAYKMDVTIRFNSDRRSGGAWLRTHEIDRVGANSQLGICAHLVNQTSHDAAARYGFEIGDPVGTIVVSSHIGHDSLASDDIATSGTGSLRAYHHERRPTLADALIYVQANAVLPAHLPDYPAGS